MATMIIRVRIRNLDGRIASTLRHRPSIPTARACSNAPCHASNSVGPSARMRFSPFAPVTTHTFSAARPTSPLQP